jgi:Family of unknown function (DUF6404)
MDFSAKRTAALDLLKAKGLNPLWHTPFIFRYLWAFGIKIPPPHMRTFRANAALFGLLCVFFVSAFTDVVSGRGWSVKDAFLIACGIVAGLWVAYSFHAERQRRSIPLWTEFHPGP